MLVAMILALAPIACVIVLGAVLRHTLVVDDVFWQSLDRLNFYVFIPAIIVSTVADTSIEQLPMLSTAAILIGSFMLIVLILMSFLRLRQGVAAAVPAFTSLFQTSTRWNGSVAIIIAAEMFDPIALAFTAVTMLVLMPIINLVNITLMVRLLSDGDVSLRRVLARLVTNPIFLACIASLSIAAFDIDFWWLVDDVLAMLADASFATILLSLGAGLVLASAREKAWWVGAASALKLVAMPGFVLAGTLLAGLDPQFVVIATTLMAVPTAMNGYALARELGGDAELYALASTTQIALSLLTVPTWYVIARTIVGAT